ncbi:MAG TPA: PA2778 family cysteine peptidase [Burkholderiales bacterium]|nr:PA2778 family cysteine peptidase [Burkholderiales bacterium]
MQPHPGLPLSTDLQNVPYFAQTEYHCGPAALAMVLNSAGATVTPAMLIDQVYLPGKQGSLQVEMLASARRNGMVAYVIEPSLGDLLLEVNAGTPVITLENYGVPYYPIWHYAVAVGFDLHNGEIVRHSGNLERKPTPLAVFEYFWRQEGRWAMVAVPPERVPVTAHEHRYAQAVIALEKTGQNQRAAIAYEAMLKRWPSNLVALMGRGNTAYAAGDLALAESIFRSATAAHADSVAAYNNLAQTLLDRGKLDEARAAAQRAVSLGGPLHARARATLEEIDKKRRGQ